MKTFKLNVHGESKEVEVAEDTPLLFVESDVSPNGLGEPALPPTNKRIRTLPINHDLLWS